MIKEKNKKIGFKMGSLSVQNKGFAIQEKKKSIFI